MNFFTKNPNRKKKIIKSIFYWGRGGGGGCELGKGATVSESFFLLRIKI